ncbi:MAG: ABC transporter ATP-binding protein [Dehalococcoidia bacterium]|nr:ABC transporter ATP-binding protein [Dehalococcoidia bacterium]
MSEAAIETRGLTRSFGDQVALDHLDLRIERGEIFGFLGPNGAGKSTTIRLLLDFLRPTSGSASVLGFDCRRESVEVRRRTGYLPGELRLYGGLTGNQTVALFTGLRDGRVDPARAKRMAAELELDLTKKASSLSKGNRQKLGVLLALLGQPEVLLLDEPTSGLDPLVQRVVWEMLRREAEHGTTVFFSSHVMSEVEVTCERVGILRAGKLVAVEPVTTLKGRSGRHVEVSFAGTAPPPAVFAAAGVREIRREVSTLEFELAGEIDPLLKALAPYHVVDLRTEQATLDEILLHYYEKEAVR